jgi:hypothetical protein
MKKTSLVIVGALVFSICFLPAPAAIGWYGHGHGHGYGYGGVFWGFGAGFLTGYLVAPRPVYVAPVYIAPPVYASPPPVVYIPAPPPTAPPVLGYTQPPPPNVASAPPSPGAQNKCREWKMIERRFEDRWDSYNGRWQTVPIEKWGWVDVPCNP